MTITEIARLAGVSVSTVSKIVNHKDESISAETRERVLAVVKAHNYRPYASVPSGGRLGAIGVLMREHSGPIEQGIIAAATAKGYATAFRSCGHDQASLYANVNALIGLRVDGLILDDTDENGELRAAAARAGIPCIRIGSFESIGIIDDVSLEYEQYPAIDYERLGFAITEKLIEHGHAAIACLLADGARTRGFFQGYKRCLFEHGITLDTSLVFQDDEEPPMDKIAMHEFSGIVCSHFHRALELYKMASDLHYDIPYDLSVATLRGEEGSYPYPDISSISIPRRALGKSLAEYLIAHIEKTEPDAPVLEDFSLSSLGSIGMPYTSRTERIVTVGSINVDNYLMFDRMPHAGTSTTAPSSEMFPGGKALNEAIGVARLGHAAAIIGRVGNDPDADWLYKSLRDFQIDTVGIQRTKNAQTGQAYVFVPRSGDSMITIMAGANGALSADDVIANERLFSNARYCLVNTEVPLTAVEMALQTAHKHKLTTVMKPSAIANLSDSILKMVDIIVPNQDELDALCPGNTPYEDRARMLLDRGCRNVVVTLGAEGCLLLTGNTIQRIPAANVTAVDSTGAGDAFIAALVSYLSRGSSLEQAARIATYAAALSVTRQGVMPALADRTTLESFIRRIDPALLP